MAGIILGTWKKVMKSQTKQKLKVLAFLEVISYHQKWTINKQVNEYHGSKSWGLYLQTISQI